MYQKIISRHKLCTFAKLNTNGRCIAPCTHNQKNFYVADCMGNTGKTMDSDGGREIMINRGKKIR